MSDKHGPPINGGGPDATNARAEQRISSHTTTDEYIGGLRRRRSASDRLPVLDSGRADPWRPWRDDHAQPCDRMLDAYRDAVLTLSAAGMTPAPFLPEMQRLWRRGGADGDLVRAVASRWEVAA
jgi:hypothetical protein